MIIIKKIFFYKKTKKILTCRWTGRTAAFKVLVYEIEATVTWRTKTTKVNEIELIAVISGCVSRSYHGDSC